MAHQGERMAIGEAGPGSGALLARQRVLAETMRDRLGRECVYVPSCRFGLYAALRNWCPPGGRVLMSPVNDDVIFFVVLAAGLRPVQAPLRPWDAAIDIDAVPEETWGTLSAVLTTNLYGNPDPAPELRARCDALGIPLFEDAAHAIGSEVAGRPVGTWGDASFSSLSKHVGAPAGAKDRAGSDGAVQPLFRVPLLVADRDAAVAALARRGIVVGHLYDPPLDDYAGPEFTDPSPAPEAARWFARHALPVDPLRAREVIGVLEESGVRPVEPPAELSGPGPSPQEQGPLPQEQGPSAEGPGPTRG